MRTSLLPPVDQKKTPAVTPKEPPPVKRSLIWQTLHDELTRD